MNENRPGGQTTPGRFSFAHILTDVAFNDGIGGSGASASAALHVALVIDGSMFSGEVNIALCDAFVAAE
jgi:hypothetical protein